MATPFHTQSQSSDSTAPAATDVVETKAPGFGLPLNYYPQPADRWDKAERPFPSALSLADMEAGSTALPLTTLREFTMLNVMNRITDKVDWHTKVFDETIAKKWREEILQNQDLDVTERMMDWIISEVRYKAKVFEKIGMIIVFNGDVVKSDTAIPSSFKSKLAAAVRPLEDVPDKLKDWHPGSDNQVLDLVHPSLFPLIYGRSKVLKQGTLGLKDCVSSSGDGVVIPVPSEQESIIHDPPSYNPYRRSESKVYSRKFQWLPSEIDISGPAKITSYINNLHPYEHEDLYSLIGEVIEAAIPLWNASLSATVVDSPVAPRILYETADADGEVEQPDADTFTEPDQTYDLVDLRKKYGKQGLQVIVKLANIILTPEKPHYPGGTWHVEGQLNEHICATALYYYSNDNIDDSQLAFRQQSSTDDTDDMGYGQDEHEFLDVVFGCQNQDAAVQTVGGVETREGRLLTFPNILQHQVQPFGLKDPTKPGHRKILALFLIDPHFRVLSTANVPPQQKKWWADNLDMKKTSLDQLPQELKDLVYDEIEGSFPIGLEEAKELRKELMEERKVFQIRHGENFEAMEFSLCEH